MRRRETRSIGWLCGSSVDEDRRCNSIARSTGCIGVHMRLILHSMNSHRGGPMGNSGPEEGIKGVVEDVKGKAKEAVGTVTGRGDLTEEGKAQQDKADAQRDAAAKEAEAEKA